MANQISAYCHVYGVHCHVERGPPPHDLSSLCNERRESHDIEEMTPEAADAVVIGAGFGGMYQLYRLREQVLRVVCCEAGGGVGGAWYWNRHPGARTDSPSHTYQYWFSDDLLNDWNWQERFPPQAEAEAYLNHVADLFDLSKAFDSIPASRERCGTKPATVGSCRRSRAIRSTRSSSSAARARCRRPFSLHIPRSGNASSRRIRKWRWLRSAASRTTTRASSQRPMSSVDRIQTVNAETPGRHCRERLAPYKVPLAWQFVCDVPKTSSGKVMRRMLHTLPDKPARR